MLTLNAIINDHFALHSDEEEDSTTLKETIRSLTVDISTFKQLPPIISLDEETQISKITFMCHYMVDLTTEDVIDCLKIFLESNPGKYFTTINLTERKILSLIALMAVFDVYFTN